MFSKILLEAAALALAITTATASCAQPSASLAQGVISGFTDSHNNSIFLGIPFAQTTGGQNRWKKPQDLSISPSVTFNATSYGPTCPQAITNSYYSRQDEDCLNLNIWVPSTGSDMPVIIPVGTVGTPADCDTRYSFTYTAALW